MSISRHQETHELTDILENVGVQWTDEQRTHFVADMERAMKLPRVQTTLDSPQILHTKIQEAETSFMRCIQLICSTMPASEQHIYLRYLYQFTGCKPTVNFSRDLTSPDRSSMQRVAKKDIEVLPFMRKLQVTFTRHDFDVFSAAILRSVECVRKAAEHNSAFDEQEQADLLSTAGVHLSIAVELLERKSQEHTRNMNTVTLFQWLDYELIIETDEHPDCASMSQVKMHEMEIRDWYYHLLMQNNNEDLSLHKEDTILGPPIEKISAKVDGRPDPSIEYAADLPRYIRKNMTEIFTIHL